MKEIRLKGISGFHIGGERRVLSGFPVESKVHLAGDLAHCLDPNGEHMIGQMYAQYYEQEKAIFPFPVLLWHGGGMTGACWENAPDDSPGWLDFFLREGFDVVVSDAFERGRASTPAYPQVLQTPPEYRSLDSIWHHFRFGEQCKYPRGSSPQQKREAAYESLQFPIEFLEQFGRQFVPRWLDTDEYILAAYAALLKKIGPAFVVAHSQGAYFALRSAIALPELVKGVIAIEPPLAQTATWLSAEPRPSRLGAHLFVWGDYIHGQNANWTRYLQASHTYYQQLRELNISAEFMELPEMGIAGNSHILIMDRNNRQIATLIEDWLFRQIP